MTDYTLRKEFPLKPEQNEAIEFMLQRSDNYRSS